MLNDIERIVIGQIHAILNERGEAPATITAEDRLHATLGLSSLDLAQLVAELEVATGADPFAKLVSVTSVRSVGDLIAAYRLALTPDAVPAEDAGLAEAQRRATARRSRLTGT